ncbi:MAG: trigger factor [Firmicutes bacterium]|nr:trigger factor [Bacillota bacterium]
MSHSVKKLEHSMVELTLEISPEKFSEAIKTVYNKQKKSISLPGFRKGKAPLAMIERVYGAEVFYEDALNEVLPDAYEEAVKEENLEVMSRPDVNVDFIEKGKPVKVVCTVAVKPEVKLGEYKGLKKEVEAVVVTDEDVEEELKKVANRNARKIDVTDRAAQMDDTVTIDYVGTIDGVEFDGGKSEDYDLKLGSHSFIDTFEDQIVGHNIGDAFDVNVTFPEQYGAAELAGKAAVFAVTLKKITANEVPEINDDFAQEVSEFDTLDEYRQDLRKVLTDHKTKNAEEDAKNKLIDAAVAASEMDIPDAIVQEQCDQMIQQFAQTLSYQGMDINQYMKMSNTNLNQLREEVKPEALKRLKENLTLDAIANAEKIEVTDEDVENEIADMAKMYSMEADKLKEVLNPAEIDNMKAELLNKKTVSFLLENAVD